MTKIESTLFVPEKLTFSENLRCLNLPLLVGALSQKRSLSLTCFVFAGQNVCSGKIKHLKYSENVNFEGTNNVDSIFELSPNKKKMPAMGKIKRGCLGPL